MEKNTINKYLPYLLIGIFSFIIYTNSIFNKYALDDAIVITENIYTKQGLKGIDDILKTDTFMGFFKQKKNLVAGGRYRPLSLVTFAIEYQFVGLNPHISHLINVLLYALTGIVLYIILKKIFKQTASPWYLGIPFIASLLFIAHPIHTEVIANIKGRDEILSFLGSLLALKFTLDYLENNKSIYLLYSSLSLFLALMSKENAVTFLAVIPLTIYFFTTEKIGKNIQSLIPLIIAFLFFMMIRYAVLGPQNKGIPDELMNNPFLGANTTEKFATIFYTLGIYIKLLFFPHPLTFDYYPYHIPIMDWDNAMVILSFLLYIALIIIALYGMKRKSLISWSILYYFATLSIVSNILFPIGAFMNERFIYMSSLGFSILSAYFIVKVITKWINSISRKNILIGSFLVVVLTLYSFKTISRNPNWMDDYSLFTTDVQVSKNSAKSNCSAGGKILEACYEIKNDSIKKFEMLTKSLNYLRQSIRIYPTYTDAMLLLGNAHFENHRNYDSAIYYYYQIIKINPNFNLAFENTERILSNNKDVDYKLKVYEDYFKINPNRFDVNYNLGNLYGKEKNDIVKAIFFLERAIKLDVNSAKAYKDLGVAYGISNRLQESINAFERAVQIEPNDWNVYLNMSVTYQLLGNMERSEALRRKALEVKQKNNE